MVNDGLTKEQIEHLLNTSRNIREAAMRSGVSQGVFERRARSFGVYRRIGCHHGSKIPIQEILDGKHPGFPTFHLAKRLVKEGVKEYKCEGCGIVEWRGRPITLQLDHVDGNPANHLLENLRLMCPNCHSQTPTYGHKKR